MNKKEKFHIFIEDDCCTSTLLAFVKLFLTLQLCADASDIHFGKKHAQQVLMLLEHKVLS
jgi:hypothetical protein